MDRRRRHYKRRAPTEPLTVTRLRCGASALPIDAEPSRLMSVLARRRVERPQTLLRGDPAGDGHTEIYRWRERARAIQSVPPYVTA